MAQASPLGPRLAPLLGWLILCASLFHMEDWSDTQYPLDTVIKHIKLNNRVWHKHGIKCWLDCTDDYYYH